MKKTITILVSILILLVILMLAGYYFRVDRFGNAKIDWVDFVKINNINYEGDFKTTAVESFEIGEQIGTVKFNVSENVTNPNYITRNGDAAYLDIGTEIYSVKPDNKAIAVKIDDVYYLYKEEK